ncbi:MAG: iron ABC transporter permease [candidate division WOR-3 bacterium]
MKYGIFILLIFISFLSLIVGPGGMDKEIIVKIRLPRVLLGIFAGGVLSFVGGFLQGLLQNPLCDPYILGISSGAGFGVALAFLLGKVSYFTLPFFAFLFSLLSLFFVYLIAQISGRIQKLSLLLSGVLVSFLFSSLTILVMVLNRKPLSSIIYLIMGNLSVIFTPLTLKIFAIILGISLFLLFFLFSYARELDILTTGEEPAKSLGVNTEKMMKITFITSSFLVAFVVSYVGSISFVGLVVPHLARSLFGFHHKRLLPTSFLLGGSLLLISDLFARTIAPVELPLSVVTAIFGVPFFLYLLRKV